MSTATDTAKPRRRRRIAPDLKTHVRVIIGLPAHDELLHELDVDVYQLVCVAAAADHADGIAWPSQDLLGHDLGVHRSSISRSLTRLDNANWLEREDQR